MVKSRNFIDWLSRDNDPCFGFTSVSFRYLLFGKKPRSFFSNEVLDTCWANGGCEGNSFRGSRPMNRNQTIFSPSPDERR